MADDDAPAQDSTGYAADALERGRRLEAAGQLSAARSAYESALKSGNKRERGAAALGIAEMLNRQRDIVNAERAYETAVDSGVPDIVPIAAFGLGMLREASGDLDGAIGAFRITVASRHHRFAADADNAIGDLLLKAGDRAAAREAFGRAAKSTSDPVAVARARLRIARLDYKEGKGDATKIDKANRALRKLQRH